MQHLSQTDQKRIADAIEAIDRKSDGEIYVLVANSASQYREVPLAYAAFTALLLPPIALALGITPDLLLSWSQGWTAQSVSESEILYTLTAYVLAQSILFSAAYFLFAWRPVREAATPDFVKRGRVVRQATQHFTSTGMHLKTTQPHVLIFVALAEHRVEIMAAPAIHAIAGSSVWEEARDAIVAGIKSDPGAALSRAVEIVGAPLIQHFPATAAHPDINAHGVGEI